MMEEEIKETEFKRNSQKKHQSKLLECLISFLKTKDDNMLLLSTNILLQILKNYKFHKNLNEIISERCANNLTVDMKFRLITFENLAKLFVKCFNINCKQDKILIIEGLKKKINIINQIRNKGHLNKKLTEIFKRVVEEFDFGEKMFLSENLIPRENNLNFLSLINYSFYEDFKNLKYINFFYKYDLNESEIIEMELKTFIILKNIRYASKYLINIQFMMSQYYLKTNLTLIIYMQVLS